MVVHLVLFQPRADLTDEEAQRLVDALRRAVSGIAGVRRCRVGRRIRHGAGYEAAAPPQPEYLALLEFDDLAALRAYLGHPLHADVSRLYASSLAYAAALDFEATEIEEISVVSDR